MNILPWITALLWIGAEPSPPATARDALAPWAVNLVKRIGVLETAPQQAWLLRLEQRRDCANRFLLKTEDADRERKQTARLLRQPMIPPTQLAELLQQTDAREKEAIRLLARRYRLENDRWFHHQTQKLESRDAVWEKIHSAWTEAGRNFEEQDRLLLWLDAALRQMASSSAGLPPLPTFTRREKLQDPAGLAKTVLRFNPFLTLAEPAPGAPQAKTSPPPIPSASLLPNIPPKILPKELPAAESPSRDASASLLKNALPEPRGRGSPAPDFKRDSVMAAIPRSPQVTEASIPADRVPIPVPPAAVGRRLEIAEKVDQPAGELATISPPQISVGQGIPPAAVRRRPGGADEAARPPTLSVAAVIPRSSRTADLPAPETPVIPEAPEPQPPSPAPASPAAAVEVNREELVAQIKGCNLSLRAIEAELDERGDWNVPQLEKMMARLKRIVQQARDLEIIRNLLAAEDLHGVDALESPRVVIALMGRRIYEIRTALAAKTGIETEGKRLDELSRSLAELAVEK
jgi:hypothetical protein